MEIMKTATAREKTAARTKLESLDSFPMFFFDNARMYAFLNLYLYYIKQILPSLLL